MIIRGIQVKDVITKSNLPVCDYFVNPYTVRKKAGATAIAPAVSFICVELLLV